jgi:hypothetical protein
MRANNIFLEQVHLSADMFIYVMNNVDSHPKSNLGRPKFLTRIREHFFA